MIELKTQRLVLKPPGREDKQALVEHLGDLEVVRWLSNVPHPYTLADAEDWIGIVAKSGTDEIPSFQLSVFMDDALIGGVGLRHLEDNVYELGYWLAREFWGKGIATEAVTALLRYAEQTLPDVKFVAHCMKGNLASSNVLDKLGFRVTGEAEIHSLSLGALMPCFVYAKK